MRRGLEMAVGGYSNAVGSFEARVLPSARRFRDLGAANGEEIGVLEAVDRVPRLAAAPDLARQRVS